MQRALDELGRKRFDVLVVGGGIHGVWTARAAAMRGLDVALAEAQDYASGTSSRSTMLAHGGLRYLAQFDVSLVKEALQERGLLTQKAPQLVQPLPFLLPFYEDAPYPKWQLKIGVRWYSWLARGSGYPGHTFLSREKVLEMEPHLSPKGLQGGALYYDGQVLSPERLTTLVALDAAQRGASLANHAEVTSLVGEERVTGAVVRDQFTGDEVEVRAHAVLNTTGPFLDHVLDRFDIDGRLLRLTKGIHLVTPRFTDHAIVVNAPDGRTFFAVPWHRHQLVGTTDTDYTDDPRQVHATPDDVSYLQEAVLQYFPDAPVDQVLLTYAGLRNLLHVEGVHPSQVTRKPLVQDHAEDGHPGLVSLAGGKLTTARATASELLDAARPHLPRPAPRVVDTAPLPGGDLDPEQALAEARRACEKAGLPGEVAQDLVALYGGRWERVARAGLDPLGEEGVALVRGQAVVAAAEEGAWTVEDVLRRRTLAWAHPADQGASAADGVAAVLVEQGVPEAVARESVEAYREMLALHRRWRGSSTRDVFEL